MNLLTSTNSKKEFDIFVFGTQTESEFGTLKDFGILKQIGSNSSASILLWLPETKKQLSTYCIQ